MPPTARRERAGKSRMDRADGKKDNNEKNKHPYLVAVTSQFICQYFFRQEGPERAQNKQREKTSSPEDEKAIIMVPVV